MKSFSVSIGGGGGGGYVFISCGPLLIGVISPPKPSPSSKKRIWFYLYLKGPNSLPKGDVASQENIYFIKTFLRICPPPPPLTDMSDKNVFIFGRLHLVESLFRNISYNM